MTTSGIGAVVFYALMALTIAGGAIVAFSRNIVRSAFALLATFMGVAGMYAMLSADFVAIVQLMVYVGGILILILFAVMLTSHISEVSVSNKSMGVFSSAVMAFAIACILIYTAVTVAWPGHITPAQPTTAGIGNALLSDYVLPFELISVLLFAALLGGVTLAHGGPKNKKAPEAEDSNGEAK